MRPDLTLKNYASAIGDYGDVLVYTWGWHLP